MKKEEQTEKVLMELYKLTSQLTKQLQPQYYYQYSGDIEDLASEYFTQFITPKGRDKSKQETLLDKFDPTKTSLVYLVKVCVTRKLIDSSRSDSVEKCSIDSLVDEYGDLITSAFQLTAGGEDYTSLLTDKKFIVKLVEGYGKLPEDKRNLFFFSLFDADSKLCQYLQPTIRKIHGCPVQQVTPKTIVLYIPDVKKTAQFDIVDGHPRGTFKPFNLDAQDLVSARSWGSYHCQAERDILAEYIDSLAA